MEVDEKLAKALKPFRDAAAVGWAVQDVVWKSDTNLRERNLTSLIGFSGYAGHHAAESRVSWKNWLDLLEAIEDYPELVALIDKDEPNDVG